MSRRNTDAITIHSILDWIEDNLESPLSLEKVSERSGYSKWHLQRMFKKETGHSLGQYIRSRKMTEIAQKLTEWKSVLARLRPEKAVRQRYR